MNKDGPSEASTTLTSLISIIQRSLNSHVDVLVHFKRRRSEYVELYRQEAAVKKAVRDWCELDRLQGLLDYYDDMVVAYELLLDLQVELESNPYPGQRLRFLQVAHMLLPDVKVWRKRGRSAWRQIFTEYELPSDYRVTFPTTVSEIDIHEIELTLLQLVQDDNTILATDVPTALNLSPNSKQYRNVKNALTNRGWQWKSRRMNNVMQKIVIPPV